MKNTGIHLINMPSIEIPLFIDHLLSQKVKASRNLNLKDIIRSYADVIQVWELSNKENLRDCEIHFV